MFFEDIVILALSAMQVIILKICSSGLCGTTCISTVFVQDGDILTIHFLNGMPWYGYLRDDHFFYNNGPTTPR